MKTAIITGVTGQDGSYLAELLLSKNYKVYGTSRNPTNYKNSTINLIKSKSKNKNIITTKKDYFKILEIENLENLFYQDINIEFLFNDEKNFIKELNKFIK